MRDHVMTKGIVVLRTDLSYKKDYARVASLYVVANVMTKFQEPASCPFPRHFLIRFSTISWTDVSQYAAERSGTSDLLTLMKLKSMDEPHQSYTAYWQNIIVYIEKGGLHCGLHTNIDRIVNVQGKTAGTYSFATRAFTVDWQQTTAYQRDLASSPC